MHKRDFLKLLAAQLGAAASGGAFAQSDFPSRQIEFVIPLPPGGPTDAAPRIALSRMGPAFRVPLVALNKPGAGGGIAAEYVAKSRPDGHTILATSNATLSVRTAIERALPYAIGDFTAIGMYASDVGIIAARRGEPFTSLDTLVDYARNNPGKLSYASAGVGSVSHVSAELFKLAYNVGIVHVPFPGSGPARTAVLGGHVPLVTGAYSAFAGLFTSGELVPLVTTASRRLAALPNVPTMAERGFADATLNIWMGFFAPSATPPAIVDTLSKSLSAVAQDPEMRAALEKSWMVLDYRDGAATREQLLKEHNTVLKAAERIDFKKTA